MTTALDTSVLISIAKGEPDAALWVSHLAKARIAGELVICEVGGSLSQAQDPEGEPLTGRPLGLQTPDLGDCWA